MDEPLTDELQQAEALFQSGLDAEARRLLAEYLRGHTTSIKAWWLMSQAVTDPGQKLDCLTHLLRLDPAHAMALAEVQKLHAGSAQPAPVQAAPVAAASKLPSAPAQPAPIQANPVVADRKPASEPVQPVPVQPAPVPSPPVRETSIPSKKTRQGRKGCFWVVDVVMGIIMVAALAAGGFYLWQTQKTRQMNNQMNDQASTRAVADLLTHLPTSTFTLTGTPTFTRTSTSTRTETPTFTLTRTPHNTATIQVRPLARFTAPDFSLAELTSGNTVTLRQYAGQPVLVVFWATWCPHCQAEMADLNKLQKNYKDQGFVLLAINSGDSKALVSSYKTSHQLTFQILLDSKKAVMKSYNTTGIPSHFFIQPNGVISSIVVGEIHYEILASQVDALMR